MQPNDKPIETSGYVADAVVNDCGSDIMMVLLFRLFLLLFMGLTTHFGTCKVEFN